MRAWGGGRARIRDGSHGGMNLYVYVVNDPINHTDRYGRDWYDWFTVPYDLGMCIVSTNQYSTLVNYCTALVDQSLQLRAEQRYRVGPGHLLGRGDELRSDERRVPRPRCQSGIGLPEQRRRAIGARGRSQHLRSVFASRSSRSPLTSSTVLELWPLSGELSRQ